MTPAPTPQTAALEPAFLAAFRSGTLTEAQADAFARGNSLELKFLLFQLSTAVAGSRRTVRRLLRKLKIGRRTARKKKTMGHHPDRNAQFETIKKHREEYRAAGDPVISIDTKKKELLGNFHRGGSTYTQQTVEVFDHDFPSAGSGKLIPHGIYDLANNHASIHLNTSHDTGGTLLRQHCIVVGGARPGGLSGGEAVADPLRRRRQQQCHALPV